MNEAARREATVEVEIYGSTYRVRGEEDSSRLQDLATLVDRKMRDVGSRVSTVDTTKIAILAALNIADELVRSREERDVELQSSELVEKVAGLAGELERALEC